MVDTVLVKNANRMMMVASLLEGGIELSFADGCKGLIPFDDIPEIKEHTRVARLSLPNPYEMVLETKRGERIELPGTSPVTTATRRTVRRSRRLQCGEGRHLANASAS